MVIPDLVQSCAQMLNSDWKDQFNGLDRLHAIALPVGDGTIIDQEGWKEEWWNELCTASFPHKDASCFLIFKGLKLSFLRYGSHKQWHQRLLERLRSLRELTRLAHDKNTSHMDICALELNQLADGYNMMNHLLMPDSSDCARMMDDMHCKESEGGRHPL